MSLENRHCYRSDGDAAIVMVETRTSVWSGGKSREAGSDRCHRRRQKKWANRSLLLLITFVSARLYTEAQEDASSARGFHQDLCNVFCFVSFDHLAPV